MPHVNRVEPSSCLQGVLIHGMSPHQKACKAWCQCALSDLGKERLGLEAGLEMVFRGAVLPLKPLPRLAQAELAIVLQLLGMAPLVQAARFLHMALPHLHGNEAGPGLHQPVAAWAKSGHPMGSEAGRRSGAMERVRK